MKYNFAFHLFLLDVSLCYFYWMYHFVILESHNIFQVVWELIILICFYVTLYSSRESLSTTIECRHSLSTTIDNYFNLFLCYCIYSLVN